MKLTKRLFLFGIFLVSIFFLVGCEGNVDSYADDEYGSLEYAAVAISVQWPEDEDETEPAGAETLSDGSGSPAPRKEASPAASSLVTLSNNCEIRGVDKVRVVLEDSFGSTITSETFDCSAGHGRMTGIAPQSGCSIVVSGLDFNDKVTYRGSKTGLSLHAGLNNVGSILVKRLEATKPTEDTFTNSIGMTFNYIKPGTFMMGSPLDEPGRNSNETQHQVTLTQGYYMQTTPVTQGQWKAVMKFKTSEFSNCGDACPHEGVIWKTIQEFIETLNQQEGTTGYTLPTEAQWEYAARAGSTTAFANGPITETQNIYDPVLDSMGWYRYNSQVTYAGCDSWTGGDSICRGTHPVAQKAPNAWGLYDMHGNVWEFVADWYGTYPSSAVVDPTGPTSGSSWVRRGGSYYNGPRRCRSAVRAAERQYFWEGPVSEGGISYEGPVGFRIVFLPDH